MPENETNFDANIRRVTENLSVTVMLFDQNLKLTYINPAGEMLLALSAKRIRNAPSSDIFGVDSQVNNVLNKALNEGHSLSERELELDLLGHRHITVDCTVTPLNEPSDGELLLVELQQVDRQLRIHKEENLIAQNQAAHLLLRGLAHEINNPLGGLRGAAQLLAKELNDAELTEYTDVIISEADRLQKLLAQLLGPKTRPQKRNTNIHIVLEHVKTLVLAETPKGINIIRDYDPSIPDLYADPDQLIQSILNIVRNAMQAMGDNGNITFRTRTQRQFTIGAKRHKLVLALDIIDDGPGIPADLQEKIFYPMVTGRAEGTGLGLSISQSLVNQHNGLIECSSKPGRTVFTLLLPLEREHD